MNLIRISFIAVILLQIQVIAQVPQGIPYQASARNSNGQPLSNRSIQVRFSIIDSTATGIEIYKETNNTITNALGLFTLTVGTGNAIVGTFSTINWGHNFKFLKVELDTTASGNNYADLGTQQMMSVPYALYALNAPVSIGEFSHYVGELFGGGIVVSVWKLGGIEHGLIASLVDLSSGVAWSNVNSSFAGATSLNNGQSNTIAIINQAGHITSAAALCNNYISGAFSDWYLPSNWEINQCYNAAFIVNSVLGDANGFHSLYWSSTESSNINAYAAGFINGVPGASSKTTLYYVRAVRTY